MTEIVCQRCQGTILPPSRGGAPRGTCHCPENRIRRPDIEPERELIEGAKVEEALRSPKGPRFKISVDGVKILSDATLLTVFKVALQMESDFWKKALPILRTEKDRRGL